MTLVSFLYLSPKSVYVCLPYLEAKKYSFGQLPGLSGCMSSRAPLTLQTCGEMRKKVLLNLQKSGAQVAATLAKSSNSWWPKDLWPRLYIQLAWRKHGVERKRASKFGSRNTPHSPIRQRHAVEKWLSRGSWCPTCGTGHYPWMHWTKSLLLQKNVRNHLCCMFQDLTTMPALWQNAYFQ